MPDEDFVQVADDGHLVLPETTFRRLHLGPGMRFQLLADEGAVLVLKLLDDQSQRSSVCEVDLRLQQAALAKIWDDPAEDIYNDDV